MESEPLRVEKILGLAAERRERRGIKERVLRPRKKQRQDIPTPKPTQYARLRNGQIVGFPRPMREVKQEARRSRLQRRENFRVEKRRTKCSPSVSI